MDDKQTVPTGRTHRSKASDNVERHCHFARNTGKSESIKRKYSRREREEWQGVEIRGTTFALLLRMFKNKNKSEERKELKVTGKST